jgi:prepilin-type processing-associated H-X9-DG protein
MAMSTWIGGHGGEPTGIAGQNFRVYQKLGDAVDPGPTRTWLFIDVREDSVNWGAFVTVMHGWPDHPTELRFREDFPASYHNGAGGLSFADGHAEIRRWLDPRTKPRITKGRDLELITASPNNLDVQWLQERATGLK